MHEAVVLGFLEDSHGLIISDVVAAACFTEVIGHISYADTPVTVVVGAAFVQLLTAVTAGAYAHAKVTFIFLEPV